MKNLLAWLFCTAFSIALSAQEEFDPTFGGNGMVLTDFGGTFTGKQILRQSDEKLIMTGWYNDKNTTSDHKFMAVRFHPDGTRDDSFGVNGILQNSIENAAATLLPDDRILVAGGSSIFRFLPNGALDTSFGNAGNLWLDFDSFSSSFFWWAGINTFEFQADGMILAAGSANDSEYPEYGEFFVIRFHPSGIPDSTFGTDGLVFFDSAYYMMRVNGLALQPDGKILAASTLFESEVPFVMRLNTDGTLDDTFGEGGVALTAASFYPQEGIAVYVNEDNQILLTCRKGQVYRFTPDGQLDSTFGTSGFIQVSESLDFNKALLLQEDGKIVVGYSENENFAIGRWNPDGSVDSTFGANGVQYVNIWGYDECSSLLLLPDGKIIAGGDSDGELSLAGLLPNGEFNADFGENGSVSFSLGGFRAEPIAIEIQSSGKLVAGGWASSGDIALARYLDDGNLDPSFGTNGKVVTNWNGFYFSPGDMAVQSDDKIVVAGSIDNHYFLFRYQPDGSPDPSFGDNGFVLIEIGSPKTNCYTLAIQEDGKYLLAGRVNEVFSMVRYMPDGTVDTAFGNGGWVVNSEIVIKPYQIKPPLALLPDGKILVGGTKDQDEFILFRYMPDGSPDFSFTSLGVVFTGVNQLASILVQPDGKILLGGCNYDSKPDPLIARLLPSGAIDGDFQFTPLFEQATNWEFGVITDMVLQSNGKIVFTGFRDDQNMYPGAIICGRINLDGSIDSSFFYWGHTGFRVGYDCYSYDIVIQPDQKVVIAGTSESGDDYWYSVVVGSDFLLARIPADPHVGVTEQNPGIVSLSLSPNPFQSRTILTYELTHPETLSILLHDASGKPVWTFVSEEKRPAGTNREEFAIPKELPEGVYYLTVQMGKGQRSVAFVK